MLLCHCLRDSNRRLSSCLDSMTAGRKNLAPPTPEQMAALLSELLRAGASLRAEPLPPPHTSPELDRQLDQYRRNVERLRDLLPSIHSALLAERSRLEAQRSRVHAVAVWARASRQTL